MGLHAINVVRQLSELAADGDTITVLTGHGEPFRGLDVDVVSLPRFVQPRFGRLGGLYRFLWTQALLPHALKRSRCSILLNTTHHGVPYRIPGIPQVLTIQNDVEVAFRFPKQHRFQHYYFRYFVPRLVRASAAVITTSQYAMRALARRYQIAATALHYAHNAYDRALFTPEPGPEDAAVRARHGLAKASYVLGVNATYPHKNIETVLAAFARVHAANPSLRLCIAGYRAQYLLPLLKAFEHSLRDATVVLPYIPQQQLVSLYRGALCLLFASYHESFGMPCVEAMAAGCPIIASNASAIPEICADAAHLVSPSDVDGFASAITRGLADPTFFETLRRKGLRRARSFDWQTTATRIYRVLLEVHERTLAP